MKNIPIIFIAGAPRSGTSFLFNLLSQHTNIAPHQKNESYFFMNKNHPLLNTMNYFNSDMDDYFSSFHQKTDVSYLLDGTDHLMYQDEMYEVVSKIENAKMVFILREPASRILSSFKFTKYNLGNFKQNISFREYVTSIMNNDLEKIDKWFYNDKRSGYILKREIEYSHYINYIEQWLNVLGKERIFFIQFERFTTSPQIILNDLFDWLDLPSINIDHTKVYKNQSTTIRYPFLHKIVSSIRTITPRSSLKQKVKKVYFNIQGNTKIENKEEDLVILEFLRGLFEKSNICLLEKTAINFLNGKDN